MSRTTDGHQLLERAKGLESKKARYIFCGIFLFSFVTQLAMRKYYTFLDTAMWADQIKYFSTNDPRVFDYYAAYGHPGTTLIELGSLLNLIFGFSYNNSIIISISTLVAGTTAACSVLCFLLHQRSYWWLTTAIILTFNRLSMYSTPPTEAVMPFIVLTVLATWWTLKLKQIMPEHRLFVLGCVFGLSAATRLDVTLLVCLPMSILVWYRHGQKSTLFLFLGIGVSFFVANPFLWFMPVQHLSDLVHKFTLHHNQFDRRQVIKIINYIHASPSAVVSVIWAYILLCQRRLSPVIPTQLIIVYSSISVIGLIMVVSSKFQAIRYLYPLIIVWEILLPLFVFERFSTSNCLKATSLDFKIPTSTKIIVSFIFLSQFFATRIGFDIISGIINFLFNVEIKFTIPFNV